MNNRDNGLALDSLVWSYRGKTRCSKCFRWHLEVEAHPSGTDIIDSVAPSSFKSTVNRCDDVREPAELQSVFENVKTPFFFFSLMMKTQNTFSCNIRVRHLVNDLSIFVSCAVPHNKTLFFFFIYYVYPIPSIRNFIGITSLGKYPSVTKIDFSFFIK